MKSRVLFLTPLEFRRRIEAAMRRKGLNYHSLSVRMGRTQTSVERSIKGHNGRPANPSLNTLKALSRELDISIGFMVDRRNPE